MALATARSRGPSATRPTSTASRKKTFAGIERRSGIQKFTHAVAQQREISILKGHGARVLAKCKHVGKQLRTSWPVQRLVIGSFWHCGQKAVRYLFKNTLDRFVQSKPRPHRRLHHAMKSDCGSATFKCMVLNERNGG